MKNYEKAENKSAMLRLEILERDHKRLIEYHNRAVKHCEDLMVLNDELREDAERYRWLRNTQNQRMRRGDHAGVIENIFVCDGEHGSESPSANDLDRCVDSEMAKWPLITWGRNVFTKGASTDVAVQGEDNDHS